MSTEISSHLTTIFDGRFTWVKKLSSSLYGSVHLASSGDEMVCIKISDKKQMEQRGIWDRPQLEIEVLKKVVGVSGFQQYVEHKETDHAYYLVTKYAEGGDLCDFLIQRCNGLSEIETVVIMRQLYAAVAHLNALGYTYLDHGLENMVIIQAGSPAQPNDWKIVLIDFAAVTLMHYTPEQFTKVFACRMPPGRCTTITPEGAAYAIETFQSYNPSEIKQWDPIKAQVLGIGSVMYSLVTGHPPYSKRDDPYYKKILQDVTWIDSRSEATFVSLVTKNLITRMLCPALERCTFEELGAAL